MASSNTIDLNQDEQTVPSLATGGGGGIEQKPEKYQPRTLTQYNTARFAYLPLFPTKAFGPNDCLLLANVPVTHLTPDEIARRQHGAYISEAVTLISNTNGFSLSQKDAEELAARLHIDMSIITFNAERLCGICHFLLALHESFRRKVLLEKDVALKEPTLNSKQMATALEFYLQIDVDSFYMKTCSFRGAETRSNVEGGLFCDSDEPEGRYGLLPCGNLFCRCCPSPSNDDQKAIQLCPVVDFNSSSMHKFLNGYTTYLNCPATCNTSNIIYSMTCPCGKYDYVDSTAETLDDAMTYHRKHGNRIIHEKLTGNTTFPSMTNDPIERVREMTKKIRLYEHSAHCPVAYRRFLKCNPDYWCFVPMLWEEAEAENIAYFRKRTSSSSNAAGGAPPPGRQRVNVYLVDANNYHAVSRCVRRVHLPPAAYAFSFEQRQKQREFFERFLSSPVDQLPYSPVDLYNVAIIAVLPDDASIILRYIIETLFIIHGETKLNMICPIGGDPEKRYGPPYQGPWCENLNRPFKLMRRSSQ